MTGGAEKRVRAPGDIRRDVLRAPAPDSGANDHEVIKQGVNEHGPSDHGLSEELLRRMAWASLALGLVAMALLIRAADPNSTPAYKEVALLTEAGKSTAEAGVLNYDKILSRAPVGDENTHDYVTGVREICELKGGCEGGFELEGRTVITGYVEHAEYKGDYTVIEISVPFRVIAKGKIDSSKIDNLKRDDLLRVSGVIPNSESRQSAKTIFADEILKIRR
ncbi:hypothetical protein D6764_05440 [Candidatus Woesearchaeota archaeon]|nr:MAG: hypothetical protein D6764_05440 [Candidatus Woesearchaeota archaeon]